MSKYLLFEKAMPQKLWGEAVMIVTYLINRLPIRALHEQTPFKAWFGRKPSFGHLRVFGSICYTYVSKRKGDKLDSKVEKNVFVGYTNTLGNYRVFNSLINKIFISKDVTFIEEES